MHQFEVAQGFTEQCQARDSVQALIQTFQQAKQSLGFRRFTCCPHVYHLMLGPTLGAQSFACVSGAARLQTVSRSNRDHRELEFIAITGALPEMAPPGGRGEGRSSG